jgi:hypothetical protein
MKYVLNKRTVHKIYAPKYELKKIKTQSNNQERITSILVKGMEGSGTLQNQ